MQGLADRAQYFGLYSKPSEKLLKDFYGERGDVIRERFLNGHSGCSERNGNEDD